MSKRSSAAVQAAASDLALRLGQPQRRQPVLISDPQGAPAEGIRALRTRIQSQHVHAGRRALAVCGATPNVGCTFVAVNLAIALSQIGLKTLLIDGNLREPGVQDYFDIAEPGGGLHGCLAQPDSNVADFTHEEVLPNLDVLLAGAPTTSAQEYIANDRFPTLINSCLRDYEMTIVDTPPASRCSDALRISTVVGFSLIVARKNWTLVSDFRTLSHQLRAERVLVVGSVLNAN